MGSKRKELRVVNDQVGCPTYAQDLARAIVDVLPYVHSKNDVSGIYNYSGDSACSWFGFAEEIFRQRSNYIGKDIPTVIAISSEEFPSPVSRPHFSVLDSGLIAQVFGVVPSDWRRGVASCLQRLTLAQEVIAD